MIALSLWFMRPVIRTWLGIRDEPLVLGSSGIHVHYDVHHHHHYHIFGNNDEDEDEDEADETDGEQDEHEEEDEDSDPITQDEDVLDSGSWDKLIPGDGAVKEEW
jgi:hypothetical protein